MDHFPVLRIPRTANKNEPEVTAPARDFADPLGQGPIARSRETPREPDSRDASPRQVQARLSMALPTWPSTPRTCSRSEAC
jgi:hypothetical protein